MSFNKSLLLLLSLFAIACGGGSAEQSSDGKTTLRVAHFWGDQQELWKEVIAEFEKANPNIRVEQQVVSFTVHKDKVLAAAAADVDAGDLILLEDWFAQELLDREYLADLQPFVDRDLTPDQIFPISLESFRRGKSLRAFPVAMGSYPLLYNKDLFDAAGLRYPDSTWTYDTLLAAAQKLTVDKDGDGKPEQWGFLLDNSGGFDGLLYSLGGGVLTPDLQRSAFNEPSTVRALQFWVDLVQKYKVSPSYASIRGGASSGGSLRPFETGRFAMAMLGSMLTTYKNNQFRWDIALPPSGPAGRKALRFAAAFGIPKNSKNVDAAWTFLRWIIKDMPAKYSDRLFYGLVPNSRRLALSPEYLNGQPKVNRQVVIDMIQNYSISTWRARWIEFRDNGFMPELDLMVNGEKTVQQAAADADRKINEVLSR
ncbi:MAG: sugar ABC transporter substrate-binding protein [Armatimonadetes bacterium]|nr:sugar ABC transporter substrate-binding protein [Armatimonadota bacterium]